MNWRFAAVKEFRVVKQQQDKHSSMCPGLVYKKIKKQTHDLKLSKYDTP